jgi:hypothetical protein
LGSGLPLTAPGCSQVGGGVGTSFELRGLLSQDVMIMVKKFAELEYSIDCLMTLLNSEYEEKSHLIL